MLTFAGALLLSFLLTWALRWYALKFKVYDIPNERSSHTTIVPRGGGLSLVIVLAAATLALGGGTWIYPCLLIAAVGFADDHMNLSAKLKLLLQIGASVWAVLSIDGLPTGPAAIALCGFWVFYLIWMTNIYNFMDGINGIAGVELLTFGAGLYALGQHQLGFAAIGASLGFLFWNWTPARIFMGDVGSTFLGFWICCVILQFSVPDANLMHSVTVRLLLSALLFVFVGDATVTLARRALRGDDVFKPHRVHAYQKAAQKWGHAPVSLSVLALNLLIGVPVVAGIYTLMQTNEQMGLPLVLIFWALCILAFTLLGSGRLQPDPISVEPKGERVIHPTTQQADPQ